MRLYVRPWGYIVCILPLAPLTSLNEKAVAAPRMFPGDLVIMLHEIAGENISFEGAMYAPDASRDRTSAAYGSGRPCARAAGDAADEQQILREAAKERRPGGGCDTPSRPTPCIFWLSVRGPAVHV